MSNKVVNWSKFSTSYSLQGLEEGLKHTKELEVLGSFVHDYWIKGVQKLWAMIDEGFKVEGGYSDEKRASHEAMLVPYLELSREDQLKDLYTIKDLLSTKQWLNFGGEEYEEEFASHNIGW